MNLHLIVNFKRRLQAHGIIAGDHKLVAIASNYEGATKKLRLYDLATDPGEEHNIANQDPERTDALFTRLSDDIDHYARIAVPESEVSDTLDLEALRALGYVQ